MLITIETDLRLSFVRRKIHDADQHVGKISDFCTHRLVHKLSDFVLGTTVRYM